MTVSSQVTKLIYNGNGLNKNFPIPFSYQSSEEVALYLTLVDGTLSKVLNNYVIDDVNNQVTYPESGVAIPVGAKLTVSRETPRTQETPLDNQGYFKPTVIMAMIDKLTQISQELDEKVSRCIRYSIDQVPSDEQTENYLDDVQAARDAAIEAAEETIALINEATLLVATATTAAATATSAKDDAEASANTATTSAGEALTSAGQAVDAKTAAETAAANADNSADSAAQSELAAGSAASAAETAETNTINKYKDFDKRYLGPKSASPSTDNEGNPLTQGALFFNTTVKQMFVWDGALWDTWAGGGGSGEGISPWATATAYLLGMVVHYGNLTYKCTNDHMSNVFEDDLEDGNWSSISGGSVVIGSEIDPVIISSAATIPFPGNTFDKYSIFCKSNGGDVVSVADPQIGPAHKDGVELTIFGTSAIDNFVLDDGRGLKLRGPWRSDLYSSLTLISIGNDYIEKGRT